MLRTKLGGLCVQTFRSLWGLILRVRLVRASWSPHLSSSICVSTGRSMEFSVGVASLHAGYFPYSSSFGFSVKLCSARAWKALCTEPWTACTHLLPLPTAPAVNLSAILDIKWRVRTHSIALVLESGLDHCQPVKVRWLILSALDRT